MSTVKMNLFLDLEGTLIDEFGPHPNFLAQNCSSIKSFLSRCDADVSTVSLFSFAIDTPDELDTFNRFILPELNLRLGIELSRVILVREMQDVSQKVAQVRFLDTCEFIQLRGKELTFHDWCHMHCVGKSSILIDDVVPNRVTHDLDSDTMIETLNIDRLNRSEHFRTEHLEM